MTSTDWARVADRMMMILLILVIRLNAGDVYEDQKKSENVRGIFPLAPYTVSVTQHLPTYCSIQVTTETEENPF